MNRNTRFISPFGVTHKGLRFYKAMINGEWVDDNDYARLWNRFDAAKREYDKQRRRERAALKKGAA